MLRRHHCTHSVPEGAPQLFGNNSNKTSTMPSPRSCSRGGSGNGNKRSSWLGTQCCTQSSDFSGRLSHIKWKWGETGETNRQRWLWWCHFLQAHVSDVWFYRMDAACSRQGFFYTHSKWAAQDLASRLTQMMPQFRGTRMGHRSIIRCNWNESFVFVICWFIQEDDPKVWHQTFFFDNISTRPIF